MAQNEKFFADTGKTRKWRGNVAFNAADLGAETEMDGQGRILFSPELRRELGIENSTVRLFAYRGRIEVLSEKTVRRSQAGSLRDGAGRRGEAGSGGTGLMAYALSVMAAESIEMLDVRPDGIFSTPPRGWAGTRR